MPVSRWEGEAESEIGIDAASGKVRIRVDPQYYRPTEVDILLGNPSKARERLGWKCNVDFDSIVREMVKSDVELVRNNKNDQS